MDLNTLANLAEVVGALMVIGGFAFAYIQVKHFHRQQHDTAAVELARSFANPEFARALRLVLSLPEGTSTERLRGMDAVYEEAAMLVSFTLESVGIMVHRRIVSLEMVWELMGGVALPAWEKLRLWTVEQRAEQEGPKFNEWTQWLCEQIRKHQVGSQPAYLQYANWKVKSPYRL